MMLGVACTRAIREEFGIFSVWDLRGDEIERRFEALSDAEIGMIQENLYYAGYGYLPVVGNQLFACTDIPNQTVDEEIDLSKTIWLCSEFNASKEDQIRFLEQLLDGDVIPFSTLMPRYTHRCAPPDVEPTSCTPIDWSDVVVSEGFEFGPADIGH